MKSNKYPVFQIYELVIAGGKSHLFDISPFKSVSMLPKVTGVQ